MRRWANRPTNKSPTNVPIDERGAVGRMDVFTKESADLSFPDQTTQRANVPISGQGGPIQYADPSQYNTTRYNEIYYIILYSNLAQYYII